MNRRRVQRARRLADRYPAAAEVLTFTARIAEFQAGINPERSTEALPELLRLVARQGPSKLREAASSGLGDSPADDPNSPRFFFDRVLRQAVAARRPELCAHTVQSGCLRPLAHGSALSLLCADCLTETEHPRGRCPACGLADPAKLAYWRAEQIPHVELMTCDGCRRYLHLVDLGRDPDAVPDIDEIAALPLDLWAGERGYAKIFPNLVGV